MDDPLVLLVEDDLDAQELTRVAFLESLIGDSFAVAGDGQEALDYLFRSGRHAARGEAEAPRLVLLDLKLPKVDGLEVLRRLRADERTRYLPVVVLSSSSEESDVRAAYRLGANSYVRKSIDFVDFVEKINTVADYWLDTNESLPPR